MEVASNTLPPSILSAQLDLSQRCYTAERMKKRTVVFKPVSYLYCYCFVSNYLKRNKSLIRVTHPHFTTDESYKCS